MCVAGGLLWQLSMMACPSPHHTPKHDYTGDAKKKTCSNIFRWCCLHDDLDV